MFNDNVARFAVGDAVAVRPHGGSAAEDRAQGWVEGYRVVAVEFEDYIVNRGGIQFAIGSLRVRAAAVRS